MSDNAEVDGVVELEDLPLTLPERFRNQFLYLQSDRDESVFWAHILIFIVFTAWGWWLILNGLDFSVIGASFLHIVNSPFHLYGHVVFSPFGETITLLGGSLFQLAVPLAGCLYFSVLRHDNFPATGDSLAMLFFLGGVVVMVLSNYWGFGLLRIEFRGRTSPEPIE